MRFSLTPPILILAALLISGCASNTSSRAIQEWARQQVAERQRIEAAQAAAQAQELARLKAENERIKAQAEADKRKAEQARQMAEASAWIAANKSIFLAELTKMCHLHRQDIMESYGLKGEALMAAVEDAELRDGVLHLVALLVWQKPDGTGGIARSLSSVDLVTEQTLRDEIIERKALTRQQLAELFQENHPPVVANTADAKPSTWTPTNETVNKGYQAAIGVGAGILFTIINNMLTGE